MEESSTLIELEEFLSDIVFCGINNIDINVVDRLKLVKESLLGFDYLIELIDSLIYSIESSNNTQIIDSIAKIEFYIINYYGLNN